MNEAALFREPLLRTPFHERARALSQLDSFIAWNGYTTVDVFSTVEHEYFAIRNASTLYDSRPWRSTALTTRCAALHESAGHARSCQLKPIAWPTRSGAMTKAPDR